MAEVGIASRTTMITATPTSTQQFVSGSPIIVHCITIAAAASTSVDFQKATDHSLFLRIRVPANTTIVVPVSFVADAGVEVTCSGANNAEVTMFHLHPGR